MRSGSLFTGTGALDMAAVEVFGTEPVWFADLDPAASALLAHHHPDVPNLRDITTVDWEQVEPVDLVTAGWPCQPFSLAGKRKGADDARALWPEVDRCLRALRPRYVLLENVRAVVAAGELGRVADSLASLGYRFAWVCLPASAVGAPHKRERFFCLAVADTEDERHERAWAARSGRDGSAYRGSTPADTDNIRRSTREEPERYGEDGDTQPRHELDGYRLEWSGFESAIRRWESVAERSAPVPTVPGARGGRVLNPALPEWMMGLSDGWITSVPGLSRNQQLRLAGNGVVPQQAIAAYRYLLDVLNQDARAVA